MGTIWVNRPGERVPHGTLDGDTMTTTTTADCLGADIRQCFACDRPNASAYWRGDWLIVSICRECAVNVLPRLLADAITGEGGDLPDVVGTLRRAWQDAERAFWQAATVAVSRGAAVARRERQRREPCRCAARAKN